MNKKVVIVGGEGNGGVIVSCIEDNKRRFGNHEWEVVGFINDYEKEVAGYPVIGGLGTIPDLLLNTDYYFFWAICLFWTGCTESSISSNKTSAFTLVALSINRSLCAGTNIRLLVR
jgi:hypothetical protein